MPISNDHIEKELDLKLVEGMIESHYHSFSSGVEPPSTTIQPIDNNSKIWRLMGVQNKSLISDSRSEIEQFIRLPLASTDKDPLQWWHDNKSTMPQLYWVACDYLAIPVSAILAEEANSAEKMTFDDKSKLHSCTFKGEICIRSWMEVLQESNVQITDIFHTTYEELKFNLDDLVGEDEVIDYMLRDNHGR